MWAFRDKIAVAGIGYSPLTRRSSRNLADLTLEACDAALADAGLGRSDLDGLATSPTMPRYGGEKGTIDGIDVVTPYHLVELLGIADRVQWISATGGMVTQSLVDAVLAIAGGICTHVLVYRSLHVPAGRYASFEAARAAGPEQWLAPFGLSAPPAWAATVMRRHFELFGGSRADLGRYIVDNRAKTLSNPNGFWKTPLSTEDYALSKIVADPISMLDCDIPVDGCAVLLLTSTERARHLRRPPALLTGFGASTHFGSTGVPMTLEDMWEGSAQTAARLWSATGLKPANIDTAQLYDGFSIMVVTWLEGMGLVPRGEGLVFLREGHGSLGGRLPINTGGGALGEGRLHGMTHLAEAVIQVTDRGGARQVPEAAHSLVTVSNGLAKSMAFVFSRDSG